MGDKNPFSGEEKQYMGSVRVPIELPDDLLEQTRDEKTFAGDNQWESWPAGSAMPPPVGRPALDSYEHAVERVVAAAKKFSDAAGSKHESWLHLAHAMWKECRDHELAEAVRRSSNPFLPDSELAGVMGLGIPGLRPLGPGESKLVEKWTRLADAPAGTDTASALFAAFNNAQMSPDDVDVIAAEYRRRHASVSGEDAFTNEASG